MRKGGGKNKGSQFEREICTKLSLWISNGKHADIFWRSSMSGGRATIIRAKGEINRQAGDICAVAPEGHILTDRFFFELKHVKDARLETFILSNRGPITGWWQQACKQAKDHGREPVIIAKSNFGPILVITRPNSRFNIAPVARLEKCDLGLFSRVISFNPSYLRAK